MSVRRIRTRGRRGRAGWEALSQAAAGSAGAALRPSSVGQPEESPRAADQGPGTSAVHPETPHFPGFHFFRLPEVQTAPTSRSAVSAGAGAPANLAPFPALKSD